MKRVISRIVLMLMSISVLTLLFNAQPITAEHSSLDIHLYDILYVVPKTTEVIVNGAFSIEVRFFLGFEVEGRFNGTFELRWNETLLDLGAFHSLWNDPNATFGDGYIYVRYSYLPSFDTPLMRFTFKAMHEGVASLHLCHASCLVQDGSVTIKQPFSISIYTDKYTYYAGEPMHLGLNVSNLHGSINVCFAIWVVRPGGSIFLYMHLHDVTIPANFSYSNPAFKSITLPSLPAGTYLWHAAFLEKATHNIIVESTAQWQFSQ